MATPDIIWPLANTLSILPSNFVKLRASTSQASVAPEKKVKPKPSNADTTAHAQNGAPMNQRST